VISEGCLNTKCNIIL